MASSLRTAGAATLVGIACVLTVGLGAQTRPSQKSVPKVEGVATVPIWSIEGKANYDAYCAVCHGKEGKGDGPAAPAMKAAVPDLTTMAQRNHGKFDALRVEYIIDGRAKTPTPAHGVVDMPIWGNVFKTDEPNKTLLRIRNVVDYIASLQAGSTMLD
jgi:mono/diheme cytochrome c family protein